jgi:hypothetical protein
MILNNGNNREGRGNGLMDSSLSILTRLQIERSRNRVSIPGESESVHNVQTGTEVHPASYTVGTGGSFPVGKSDEA